MTPDLATATARARQYLTRRRFLGGTAAFTAGLAVDTVLDPFLDPFLEPARETVAVVTGQRHTAVAEPMTTRVMDVDRATEREGNDQMRAALAMFREGRAADLSAWVLRRATTSYLRDGERWQGVQGAEIQLWPGYDLADIPMRAQPDPILAADACRRFAKCTAERAPAFWRCIAWVRDDRQPGAPPWERRWAALTLPTDDVGGAVSITVRL